MSRCTPIKEAAVRAANRCLKIDNAPARTAACRRANKLMAGYGRACGWRLGGAKRRKR